MLNQNTKGRWQAGGWVLATCLFPAVATAAVTIQENETGFCSYDGVITTVNSGYTGRCAGQRCECNHN